ncbi:MAG: chemotaxis protein CheD [Nitrospirota bacterium]|nr:MAG: chemotaxis protein CheD [Nitrospirota bacterium]
MKKNRHFLNAGVIFVGEGAYDVTTILGSCVSVCLYDKVLKVGGINHYLLPLWNGDGLESPRYGNVAITKLIKKMESAGSSKKNMIAKVFGGASVINNGGNGLMNIGERNIEIAKEILKKERLRIVGEDVGGDLGRKLIFDTYEGSVLVKKLTPLKKILS